MKRYIFILLCLPGCFQALAQIDPLYSQYMFNAIQYNPGITGSGEGAETSALHRTQWSGLAPGPQINSFGIHTPISYNRIGIGIAANQLRWGQLTNSRINVAGSYKILLLKGTLSFGMAAGVDQLNLSFESLNIKDNTDSDLQSSKLTSPDLAAGLYYQSKKAFLGISSTRLLGSNLTDGTSTISQIPTLYVTGGWRTNITENWNLIATSLLMMPKNTQILVAGTAHLAYKKACWVGPSVKSSGEWGFQTGVQINEILKRLNQKIRLGYSYDARNKDMVGLHSGTHEIIMVYEFKLRPNLDRLDSKKQIISPVLFY